MTSSTRSSCNSKGCVFAWLIVILVLFFAVGLVIAMNICCTRARRRAKAAVKASVKASVRRVVSGKAKPQAAATADNDDMEALVGSAAPAEPAPVYTKYDDRHYGPRHGRYSIVQAPYYPNRSNSQIESKSESKRKNTNTGRVLASTVSSL